MTRLLPNNNPLACSIYELERMIACSPTWQGLLGTTDWKEARDRIAFIEDDADPSDFPRPCCVVTVNNGIDYTQIAGGDRNVLWPQGDLWVYLALDVPDEYKLTAGSSAWDQSALRKNQLQYMSNVFGDFVQDLAGLAGVDQTIDTDHTASHLGACHIRLMDFVRNPEVTWEQLGQFWYAIISVRWGDS